MAASFDGLKDGQICETVIQAGLANPVQSVTAKDFFERSYSICI